MSSASTVSVAVGVTWYLRIRMDRPISMVPRMIPSHISVCCARRARGRRNEGTALAIASTPVSAAQPEAKARSRRSRPMVSVADGTWWDGATAGCDRIRPPMMTAKIATMKMTVGAMNSRAESAAPHRLAAVMRARMTRQISTRPPYSDGNAETSASTPADTPTAAFST